MHVLLRGRWDQWLRLGSGLILFTFVLTHFSNHALGLISVDAMETVQTLRWKVTRSLGGTFILASAAAIHIILALVKLAQRTTWRMPLWEAAQITTGLLVPFLLIPHVMQMRGAAELHNVNDFYIYALLIMWPGEAITTAILMTLVWVHSCIGLHFWLRLSPVYLRLLPVLFATAVAIPLLAFAGFTVAARAVDVQAAAPGAMARLTRMLRLPDEAASANIGEISDMLKIIFATILAALVLYHLVRGLRERAAKNVEVDYVDGPVVRVAPGPTLLEISRLNKIPHTSVCGGRARCSTCRVNIQSGQELLHPPGTAERRTLRSINAQDSVRLACQVRPKSPLTVFRLISTKPASQGEHQEIVVSAEDAGVEKDLVILFMDVRGFTRWSEGKLPYDVVFLLNEFFASASRVVREEGGWIDKYMGDGMMAVFGRNTTPEMAAEQALNAVARIDIELEEVAARLVDEVGESARIGLGLHAGTVVLGRIGYQDAGALTVIGEAVNTASRLESLSGALGLQLVISKRVAELSGRALNPDTRTETEIRGLTKPVEVLGFASARSVAG